MLDLATIEHSRRLRRRYLAWVHVLAAVAVLMVINQFRHMETLHARLAIQGDVLALLHAEQDNWKRAKAEIALLRRQVLRADIIIYIQDVAPRQPAARIGDAILDAADTHDVEPRLLTGVFEVESAFNPRATSITNARGLGQIVRSTAREIGLAWRHAYNIEQNVHHAALYLRRLLDATDDDVPRALRRYNGNYDPRYPDKVLAVQAHLSRN